MATESPAAAAFKPGINADAYHSLRSQVQLLKTERKQVLGARRAAKQLENLAYLQRQNEAQQQEEAYLDKISKLQTSLQEANERCGKIRQQYERAQRVLQAKADRLAKQLEEQHVNLSSGTNDLQQQHAKQLSALQIQLKELKHLQAHQQVQWEAEQHSIELKAAQWCEEQVHAVRREAAEGAAAAEAICDSRSVQCQELEGSLREAQEKTSSTVAELRQAQLSNAELAGSIRFLQEELAAAKSANMQLQTVLTDKQQSWHGQSLSMQAEHEKQVAEYSQRKLQEMNDVHVRFREVLQKKEDAHANDHRMISGPATLQQSVGRGG
ncbi:hypothetical protein WJX77_012592 [Trebouxia sp. C0004]